MYGKTIRIVCFILTGFMVFSVIPQSSASTFSRGKINEHYSYRDLRFIEYRFECYLYGTIVNESVEDQKNIKVTFQALDIFDKLLWETTVYVKQIGQKSKNDSNEYPFKKTLSGCKNPYKWNFIVQGHKQTPPPVQALKPSGPVSASGYVFIRKQKSGLIIEGMGNQISDCFIINKGVSVIESTHHGKTGFLVRLINCNDKKTHVITSGTADYHNINEITFKKTEEFQVDVKADLDWSIHIKLPETISQEPDPESQSENNQENEVISLILNNGQVIKTSRYYVEENTLYYYKYSGVIGINRSDVREIQLHD